MCDKKTQKHNILKWIILSVFLIVDLFLIAYVIFENKLKYWGCIPVLLIIGCTYVRISAAKSKKKEVFKKVEKYLSDILMKIILVGNILVFIPLFYVLVIREPVHTEDYGFGLLAILSGYLVYCFDVFTYPFVFLFWNKRITKIILMIKPVCIFFILIFSAIF